MKELIKINDGDDYYDLIVADHDTKEYIPICSYIEKEHVDMSVKAFMTFVGSLPYKEISEDNISDHYAKAIRIKIGNVVLINNLYISPLEIMANPTNTKLLLSSGYYPSKLAENTIKPLTKMKTTKSPYLYYDVIVTEIDKHIKPYNIYNNSINIQYMGTYNSLNNTIEQIKKSIIKKNMSNLINQLRKNGKEYSLKLDNINIEPIVDEIIIDTRPYTTILSKTLGRLSTKTIFRDSAPFDFITMHRTKFFVYLLPFLGYDNIKSVLQALFYAISEIADVLLISQNDIMKYYQPYLNIILENVDKDYFIEASEEFKFKNADEVTGYIINDLQN